MTAFRELDTVVLTHDLPEVGLCAGDIGAVVQLYLAGSLRVLAADGRNGGALRYS
jgi:hypothetical protein